VRGLTFGTITGPLTFAPGACDVKISDANSLAPCRNTPILDRPVTLESGKSVSAVFSLSQTGTPALATFSNNFATGATDIARVLIAHAGRCSHGAGHFPEHHHQAELHLHGEPRRTAD
jgi:hypothetical protein